MARRVDLSPLGLPIRKKTFAPKTAVAALIDGVTSIDLTAQYQNAMIGSDSENNKWDILNNYTP